MQSFLLTALVCVAPESITNPVDRPTQRVSRQYLRFQIVKPPTVGKSSQYGILHKEKCRNVVLLEHQLTQLKDGSLISWEKQPMSNNELFP